MELKKDKQIIVAPYISRTANRCSILVQLLKKNLPAHESKYFLLDEWCNLCFISGELQKKAHELNHGTPGMLHPSGAGGWVQGVPLLYWSCSSYLCCANRNTQQQMLWQSRTFAKFFGCMTWLAKMDLIPIFTLSKGSNGLVLNLASWESVRCVGIFVVLIIWILFVGSESCKLANTAWWCRGHQP